MSIFVLVDCSLLILGAGDRPWKLVLADGARIEEYSLGPEQNGQQDVFSRA